ncbi:MAG: Clp1/GlmU family protein [Desulfurococcaceae archaeon]
MPGLKLSRNEGVKLFGPMSVTVERGCVDVHGKITCAGERFIIHRTRNYVVIAVEDSELDVSMIDESQIQALEDTDPYREKRVVINDILKNNYRKVVVVGCVDCGKTSFVTMTYNVLLSSGRRPVVIDGDVGQADIGPPGFVSMGFSEAPVYWINELKPAMMRFIGDIKPHGYSSLIIHEIKKLAEASSAKGFDSIIVDTDGWVKDEPGINHKFSLIEELKPDAIVVLGEDLKDIFKHFSKLGIRIYELNVPKHRKTRSREERRMLRSYKYREFLENAGLVRLKMDGVLIQGCGLFHGVEIDASSIGKLIEGKVIYATKLPGQLNIYGSIKTYHGDELKNMGFEKVKIYPTGFEKGLYCAVGLLGGTEYPCLIEKFDFESREVALRTKYNSKIEVLKLSKIKLTQDFTEEYIEV